MIHYGDIRAMHGASIEPVDCIVIRCENAILTRWTDKMKAYCERCEEKDDA